MKRKRFKIKHERRISVRCGKEEVPVRVLFLEGLLDKGRIPPFIQQKDGQCTIVLDADEPKSLVALILAHELSHLRRTRAGCNEHISTNYEDPLEKIFVEICTWRDVFECLPHSLNAGALGHVLCSLYHILEEFDDRDRRFEFAAHLVNNFEALLRKKIAGWSKWQSSH